MVSANPADKQHAPAAERNREPILEVLSDCLPASGLVLEIAGGTGEHAVWFAERLPGLTWQPSDPDPSALASIAAWVAEAGLENLRPPIRIDVREGDWGIAAADAIVCINMIHISPWAATEGLLDGAARLLPAGAPLYLYGPYRRGGAHTAESNEAFDQSLRARNPEWGVRDLEAVTEAAAVRGLSFERAVPMPANNLSVILRRDGSYPAS